MSRVFAVAVILFCFEIGFFLIFVPWSSLWENNLLFAYYPDARELALHAVTRSAVSGLGFVDCLIGVSEIRRFSRTWRARRPRSVTPL